MSSGEERSLATTGSGATPPVGSPLPVSASPMLTAAASIPVPASVPTAITPPRPAPAVPTTTPGARQLSDLPVSELQEVARDYGLDPADYKTPQHLVMAIHERRHLIASLDRDAMLDVLRWANRPVPNGASSELLALNIARVKTMRFHGLSQRGLIALSLLRGLPVQPNEPVPALVRKLKRQEGLFDKLNRKRRAMIGKWVSNIMGESPEALAAPLPTATTSAAPPRAGTDPRSQSIRDEIEESGLFGGITNRLKKSADSYVNQKLDEIEARIDRKLDEIDRRLAEWRDKEIANRLRILKITLWASVVVAAVSLIYAYVEVYIFNR